MTQIPQHILDSQNDLRVASDNDLKRAQRLAKDLIDVTANIEHVEKQLKDLKKRRAEIESREIPDLFGEIGVDSVGIPDGNCDVVVKPFYKANIAATWDEERREQAFRWLEENGYGDIISIDVTVSFKRGERALADSFLDVIRKSFPGANSHPPVMKMGVPWNTLTALVKEQIERGEAIPLDVLGATVGQVASITKRKS